MLLSVPRLFRLSRSLQGNACPGAALQTDDYLQHLIARTLHTLAAVGGQPDDVPYYLDRLIKACPTIVRQGELQL